ncbi:Sec-independent protein translocase subunit TatA [Trueperella pecoris]|uniref:Sec-independent protein translocase protein TatA n=1 Tax=Trueperella pecoris TaxID=2733571 RepID=A0A7M1QWS6_9ACTO|nr:Sec-independent protein translocase subunit TatA [Trueperella pecoris]QOQ38983.1 Sec-independent protein translocase subunit TatA [Trueperella pecoris]QOR46388.1 Sec-independent protein translocase subunit TatA [Trueperella pecoris]QTG76213.1 Sec-independent protein translocase subunit TatA [Trueperella pecoris]
MKPWHIIVLLVVILIIFGTAKLPDIARSLGQSAKVLKKELRELNEDDPQQLPPSQATPAQQPEQPYVGGVQPSGYQPGSQIPGQQIPQQPYPQNPQQFSQGGQPSGDANGTPQNQ